MSKLVITDLHVDVLTESGPKEILKGVNLTANPGEVHAIMGPNGSGKSTLAYAIAGHPKYEITSGTVTLDGVDLTELSVDERAREGLFLAMQYPVEVPGVSVANFLRTAKTALDGEAPKIRTWVKDVEAALGHMQLDKSFSARSVTSSLRSRAATAGCSRARWSARPPTSAKPISARAWRRACRRFGARQVSTPNPPSSGGSSPKACGRSTARDT